MNRSALFLALLFSSVAAAQEGIYTLEPYRPSVGDVYLEVHDETLENWQKVSMRGNPVQEGKTVEGSLYTVRVQIDSVGSDGWSRAQLAFESATARGEGEPVDMGLAGRTIECVRGEGDPTFTVAGGGLLSEMQRAYLSEIVDSDRGEGPSSAELFLPQEPVAIGQSWSVELDGLIEAMQFEPEGIDREASTARGMLQAVEEREGIEYGTLSIRIELAMTGVRGVALEDGARLTVEGTMTGAIDGSAPFGEMDVRMRFVGTSKTVEGGEEILLEFRIDGDESETRTKVE